MLNFVKSLFPLQGMLLEGAPLLVRYPNKIHTKLGMSKTALTDSYSHPR